MHSMDDLSCLETLSVCERYTGLVSNALDKERKGMRLHEQSDVDRDRFRIAVVHHHLFGVPRAAHLPGVICAGALHPPSNALYGGMIHLLEATRPCRMPFP